MKWAQNKLKLARAILECGNGATEEQIKAKYIQFAGRVLEEKEIKEVEVKEEVKRGRPKKNVE